MRILITGGTGLVGRSAVSHLLQSGHQLRVLSRNVDDSSNAQVEPWPASVADAPALEGAATDCDVALHVAGIAAERPPEATFELVNVEGTRNILAEAQRANVRRFVYVSSLGADSGSSNYHASKRQAEELVRAYPGEWVIARPGNVYGPGDGVLSRLVTFMRSLPVIPMVDGGDHPFQPVWHDDIGAALAALVNGQATGKAYDLAGPDLITMDELCDILAELIGKHPQRLPIPAGIVGFAARFASALRIDFPIAPDTIDMLLDGNFIRAGRRNALPDLVATPITIREGLRKLMEDLPAQDLAESNGRAQHRRVRAKIREPRLRANELFQAFTSDCNRFMPVEADVEKVGTSCLSEGEVLTLALPLRGNISVRVVECEQGAVTLAALEGHPLAGFVRFTFTDDGPNVVFEVNVYDRPASMLDAIGMALGGRYAQKQAWLTAAENVVEASGGTLDGEIQHEVDDLSETDVERVQTWFASVNSPDRYSRDRTA